MQQLVTMPHAVRWLLTLAFAALIIAVSLVPGRGRRSGSAVARFVAATPPRIQKLMHVVFYALLAGLLWWSLDPAVAPVPRAAIAFALTTSIGAALEFVQVRIPGRFGTATDVFLNAVGAFLGVAVAAELR